MRKSILSFFILILAFLIVPERVQASEVWPEGVDVDSLSACVVDIDTGTILYEKDMDMVNYPASITKIMTAKLAIENSDMDEVVTFSEDAVYKNEGDTSHIWRDIGEEMTMEQCLYGMMLASANECAWAIGEHISGDMDSFVKLMNETAQELGCKNTHFANPNGLPDEEHYTSAHDMALIAADAYKNETFRIICATRTYTIPETNKHDEKTYLANHHKMLFAYEGDSAYLQDYCTGGKTGYTIASNSTLVTYGEKNGLRLVCVVMNVKAPGHYLDTTKLMDYCFENFQTYKIADHVESGISTSKRAYLSDAEEMFTMIDEDAIVVLPYGVDFSAANETIIYVDDEEDVIGRLEYTYADKLVGMADVSMTNAEIEVDIVNQTEEELYQEETEETDEKVSIFEKVKDMFILKTQNTIQIQITPKLIFLVLGVIVGIVLLVLIFRFIGSHMYIIRRRRAERRAEKAKRKGATIVSGKHNKWGRGNGLHF